MTKQSLLNLFFAESDDEENPDEDDDGEDVDREEEEDDDGDQRMGSSGIKGEGLDGQVDFNPIFFKSAESWHFIARFLQSFMQFSVQRPFEYHIQ